MKKVALLLILFTIVSLTAPAAFAQTKVGTTAAPFLGIGVGSRAIGMGGAFVAVADDASALYWNNAGIVQNRSNEVLLVHTEWIGDISFDYVGTVFNMGDGSIGLSLTSLSMGDMDVTTVDEPEGTGERFDAADIAIGLTYAHAVTDRFSIGGTVKYINQKIWKESASAFAIDLGTLYKTPFFNGMKIGAVISNFGSKMKMDGDDLVFLHDIDETSDGNNENTPGQWFLDEWTLPIMFRVGIAIDVYEADQHRITIATDAAHPNDNEEYLNVGGEYAYNNMLFLRAGLKSAFVEDAEEGATYGAGFRVTQMGSVQFGLDYAFEDFGRLENVHKFSLGIQF